METTMIYLEKIFKKERHAIHSWTPERSERPAIDTTMSPLPFY
ncbi:hypothetical protein [Sporosarcina sp. ACRSL]|nr:hypothetical protein [Sporosarcina sp. ACRSL]